MNTSVISLSEAVNTYLNKIVDIDWTPDHGRKNATVPMDTVGVRVVQIYENCHGEILAKFNDKISVPVLVKRLKNARIEA